MLKGMQEILEYGFEVLNETYYGGMLPPIVISIMSSPRTNGHFTVGRVWRADDERYNEINISAEHLERPIENIMATLNHEMVHYYCQLNNIADTSQSGRYHNSRFKEEAEKRGLKISKAQYIGWSVTEPSEQFIELLRTNNIQKPMDINRDGVVAVGVGIGAGGNGTATTGGNGVDGGMQGKRKTSTRKYVCPSCSNSFRATKDINVLCMDCVVQYVKAGNK